MAFIAFSLGIAGGYFAQPYVDKMIAAAKAWMGNVPPTK